jgi:hypothetical protein
VGYLSPADAERTVQAKYRSFYEVTSHFTWWVVEQSDGVVRFKKQQKNPPHNELPAR